jgi:arginine N-succinyltransferase
VQITDLADMMELAILSGIGMTSLPKTEEGMRLKIENSVLSFQGKQKKLDEIFVFVLVDTTQNKVVGTSAITAHVGSVIPLYAYKVSFIKGGTERTLHLVNDYTGVTEIGGLFLHPEHRKGKIGKFLAKTRYMFMAQHPHFFSNTVISEIRGVYNELGGSDFYTAVAEPHTKIPFKDVSKRVQSTLDALPKDLIYVSTLPANVQKIIGQSLDDSKPALAMLNAEGFKYRNYIDLFDAGPTLEVDRDQIKTIKESIVAEVCYVYSTPKEENIIVNDKLLEFKAIFNNQYLSLLEYQPMDKIRYCGF